MQALLVISYEISINYLPSYHVDAMEADITTEKYVNKEMV